MRTIVYVFLLSCSALLGGCWRTRQTQEPPIADKEPLPMVQVQKLTVTDVNLILDYQVSNPFDDDIWICQDTSVYGPGQVIIRIDRESLWIRLRFNIERESLVLLDPAGIAKYLRVRRGDSYSGRILLDLPIPKLPSGVYSLTKELAKKRKQIVLHRAVFELGYFGPKCNKFFDAFSATYKNDPLKVKRTMQSMEKLHELPIDPFIVEEIQDAQSREVMYVGDRSGMLKLEESAKTFITDVNIPCSVVVEDK